MAIIIIIVILISIFFYLALTGYKEDMNHNTHIFTSEIAKLQERVAELEKRSRN